MRRAFSLLEVLLALAIFVIGFVAIASMFPVAGLLQKQTVEDAVSQQFGRSAKAMIQGRGLSAASDLNPGILPDDFRVHPVPSTWLSGVAPRWTLNDRSSPSSTSAVLSRQYYWIPLVRRTTSPGPTAAANWQVFLFCVKREDKAVYQRTGASTEWANYDDGFVAAPAVVNGMSIAVDSWFVPGVFNAGVTVDPSDQTRFVFATAGFNADANGDGRPDEVAAGDQVLDSNGTIYVISQVDDDGFNVTGYIYDSQDDGASPSSIWYARPGANGSVGTSSPTRQLSILAGAVKN